MRSECVSDVALWLLYLSLLTGVGEGGLLGHGAGGGNGERVLVRVGMMVEVRNCMVADVVVCCLVAEVVRVVI